MLKVLSLFAGVGGFDLGLERTGGFETVAFCEIEPFARKVLAKHWPEVPCYHDVRELTSDQLAADGISVDVICGGFPCQDISFAGLGAGLAGERSGLWSEIARLAGELRPQYLVLENVAALLSRGLGDVLGDLAALGYDAEWRCIPASAIGAPHRRDRVWIVAYPASDGQPRRAVGHQDGDAAETGAIGIWCEPTGSSATYGERAVAHAPRIRWDEGYSHARRCSSRTVQTEERAGLADDGWWSAEPDVGRVANGVPDRAHRLKGLGNAVVPQIPELIGNAILQSFQNTRHGQSDPDRFSGSADHSVHEVTNELSA